MRVGFSAFFRRVVADPPVRAGALVPLAFGLGVLVVALAILLLSGRHRRR